MSTTASPATTESLQVLGLVGNPAPPRVRRA